MMAFQSPAAQEIWARVLKVRKLSDAAATAYARAMHAAKAEKLQRHAIEEENSWLQRHRQHGGPQWAEQATVVRSRLE